MHSAPANQQHNKQQATGGKFHRMNIINQAVTLGGVARHIELQLKPIVKTGKTNETATIFTAYAI
jgi:protein required for attachment to host cells